MWTVQHIFHETSFVNTVLDLICFQLFYNIILKDWINVSHIEITWCQIPMPGSLIELSLKHIFGLSADVEC